MEKRKKYQKRVRKVSLFREISISFILLVILNLAYFTYSSATSCETLKDFLRHRRTVIVLYMVCIFSLIFSTLMIAYVSKLRWRYRSGQVIGLVFCLLLIWFKNQGTSGYDNDFGYGYYASRGVIILYISVTIVFGLFILINKILFHFFRKIMKNVWIVFILVICIYALYITYSYLFRVSYARSGLFGGSVDLKETGCSFSDDHYFYSHLFPRHMFHIIFLSYWCTPHKLFTRLVETDPDDKMSKVEIYNCRETEYEVSLIPNIHYYTYEELKSVADSYPFFSLYSKNFRAKMERKKFVMPKGKTSTVYSWDSDKYETIFIQCGDERNVVASPKRIRVNDRKLLMKSKERPNIIFIFIDSLARKNFPRELPLTAEFFNPKRKGQQLEFFEFFNGASVGGATYQNVLAFMTGVGPPAKSLIPVHEHAKRAGYVTSYSGDCCVEWSNLYNHFGGPKDNITYVCDYVHAEPACDPSYTPFAKYYDAWIGASSSSRRCLFQGEAYEYPFEYSKKIQEIHPDVAKWMYISMHDGHEMTGESLKYVDWKMRWFLEYLEEKKVFEESIVFLLSDHGSTLNFLTNAFREGLIEGKHPSMNMAFPKGWLTDKQRANLKKNVNRIFTAFDIHKTQMELIGVGSPENVKGYDVINDELPYIRTCEDLGNYDKDFCPFHCDTPKGST